ncbi:MAG: GAP family protein [Acidimicrobiia bacterium]
MWSVLLRTLPYAAVNAASPTIPIAAFAFLTIPGRGRRALLWYFLGCTVVVVAVTVSIMFLVGPGTLPRHIRDHIPTWADGVLGLGLLISGLYIWKRGRRPRTKPSTPRTHVSAAAIVGVGAYMELINLVTPPAYITGIVIVKTRDLSPVASAIVVCVDALIVLLPVAVLALLAVGWPQRVEVITNRVRVLAERYGHECLVALLVGSGLYFLGRWGWDLALW